MHLRALAILILSLLVSVSAWSKDPANPAALRDHPARAAFPQIDLREDRVRGERALQLLGQRLSEVARWYGRSDDEFRALMRNDRRMRLDRRGRLFVEDELEAPLPTLSADEGRVLQGTLLPLDQTFTLHSRPGARRTVYLNFRGATLGNTAWNGGGGTITALPFDLDGVPYSFSSTELERIQYIWQRVAEDFAPFDVDVTTEQPPADALTRSGSTDQVFGTTVLVTSSAGVYSCSCGGVAYIGVFDDTGDFYKPALVFYNQLGAGNEKYVAEAISHEAGHNVGLLHDGYSGGAYYGGQGSGATGWAPIMGVGYSRSLVQWSKGEYSTANNTQDDFAVMQNTGLPIRLDDHGDTIGSATALEGASQGGSTAYAVEGLIERASDVDMFAFVASAGPVAAALNPAARSPNLDAKIELLDGAGKVLASSNPVDALNASLTATLPASGTYYISVQGVGKGDPLTTGYTDYGSVGLYALTVTAGSVAGQPPVAAATATPTRGTVPLTVNFSSAGSSDPDGSIVAYEWTFGDGSAPASGPSASHVYTTAGSFTAQLKVTDDLGLSATKSLTITVNPVVTITPMHVAQIDMSLSSNSSRRARAIAAVRVVDGNGQPIAGATVSGRWSGVVSGNASATTGSTGVASFNSPNTRSTGTFTFTVTGITLTGHSYDSAANVETSDSITR